MKAISQITQEITTTMTHRACGDVRIDMYHHSGVEKLAFVSSTRAGDFAAMMSNSMASNIVRGYEQ